VTFTGDACCYQCGYLLTTNSTLFGPEGQVLLNSRFTGLCGLSKKFIVNVTDDKTSVHVFSIKQNANLVTFRTKMAMIKCFVFMGNAILLTGQSDCAVCAWNLDNLSMIARVPSHSVPVSAVAGNIAMDLIVSVDEENNVALISLSRRQTCHFFEMPGRKKSKHLVKILLIGMIAISCFAPGDVNSTVFFYDMCGSLVKQMGFPGEIEAMELIDDGAFGDALVIATSTGKVIAIDCGNFRTMEKTVAGLEPKFLSPAGPHTVQVVIAAGEGIHNIYPVEFT
jgi:hypothetical protein